MNTANTSGNTALHMSAEYNFSIVSKRLIEAGADPFCLNYAKCAAHTGTTGRTTLPKEVWENYWTNANGSIRGGAAAELKLKAAS